MFRGLLLMAGDEFVKKQDMEIQGFLFKDTLNLNLFVQASRLGGKHTRRLMRQCSVSQQWSFRSCNSRRAMVELAILRARL